MNEEMQKELNDMKKATMIYNAFEQYEAKQQECLDALKEYIYKLLHA